MSETANPKSLESLQTWVIDECKQLGLRISAAEDDFFEAGGTSLTAVKLIERAEKEFGDDSLPADELFTKSRVAEIATAIQQNINYADAASD